MTLTPKNLYLGYLPTTIGDLYTVPTSGRTFVHNILVCNVSGTVEGVSFSIYNGSQNLTFVDSMALSGHDTVIPISFPNEGIPLESGWKIRGNTTSTSAVVTIIGGTENV